MEPNNTLKPGEEQPRSRSASGGQFNVNLSHFVSEKDGKVSDLYDVIESEAKEGGFGIVKRVIHKRTKEVRAMKVISKRHLVRGEDNKKIVNDVEILRKLDHPNILRIHEFFQDQTSYYIIYEFCSGGELFDKIIECGALSEPEVCDIMRQILSAVWYAHKNNIVHRDLKPENILLDKVPDGHFVIKVIDWGAAKHIVPNAGPITEKIGSIYWVAPEVLKKEYNEKCDVWSCGAIMYALLSGCPPFDGKNDMDIEQKILKGKLNFRPKEFKDVSKEAKDLITSLMTYDYKERPSAEEALAHPWFSQHAKENRASNEVLLATLDNLKSFNAEMKIQKAALTFIATQLISKDERNKMLEAFKELDKNGDGVLSREEIFEGYKKSLGEAAAAQEVDRIMKMVDLDNSGAIDYTEFLAAAIDKSTVVSKDRLLEAFKLFDKDGNGSISVEELKGVLGAAVKDFDEESWKELIKEVDENGDGEISFEEFSTMMLRYC